MNRDDEPSIASSKAAALIDLLAQPRRVRIRAIRNLAMNPDAAFALRRVLFTDRDAEVRAAAARKLGDVARAEPWLLDALGDRSPLVIDSIIRALSRCGGTSSVSCLRALAADGRLWWVRRSAIYALAAIAGAAEVPVFTAALADPFWRVRHAAVKVLVALGARDPEIRDEILAAPALIDSAPPFGAARSDKPDPATITFLRSSWGPVALDAPVRATSASELPAALLDPDPAVVTARLATSQCVRAALPDHAAPPKGGAEAIGKVRLAVPRSTAEGRCEVLVDPRALVELLCDPHAPLRYLAAEHIAESGELSAYLAALDWLEEPRIPHVCETVEYMLDRLGDPAAAVATHALAQDARSGSRSTAEGRCGDKTERAGAARWAISWVVATNYEALYDAVRGRARADRTLRAGALKLIEAAELLAWADATLTDAIAVELHRRRSPALAYLDATAHPRTRALQLDAAARAERWAVVTAGLADAHHAPRAVATHWLVRTGRLDPVAQLADPDPAIREAALSPAHVTAFVTDRDPWVARAAAELIATTWGGAHELPDDVAAAACLAMRSTDPWVRAQGCRLPLIDARALGAALDCLADRDPMVRAAAHEAFTTTAGIDDRVRALLPEFATSPRTTAAYAWLLRNLDDTAAELASSLLDGGARDALLAAVAGRHVAQTLTARERTPRAIVTPPQIQRRPFGRAGFAVAPLAISGAFDLALPALDAAADAGVDLFFWEPSYLDLTRFLRTRARRSRTRVIAGSYHAEAAAIELDVDRALHQLRRDTLDTFLLFWSRSAARIDHEAFAMLERIKRTGKVRAIGFSTHHRELARAAIEADPWDVVMVRHSAAHPGIERELLPTARAHDTAVLTFSALTYGRMVSGPNAPSATECYRYSMSQPGVTACISAPRRHRELVENVAILAAPQLSAERQAELRMHGIGVRAESQRFNTLLRQPTRDAAAAARELLAAELPPGEAQPSRRLPYASEARRAKTSLGKARR